MSVLYAVMKCEAWADIELEQAGPLRSPVPIHLQVPPTGWPTHYIPVFESLEDAEKYADGRYELLPMRTAAL